MVSKRPKGWISEKDYKKISKIVPVPTIDLVILRENKEKLEVLLLIRKTGYEKGKWCIIGGRQLLGERTSATIKRQAADLGVEVKVISPFSPDFPCLVNDDPKQDKTKHSITRVYPVEIVKGSPREEGEEYKGYKWFDVKKLPKMAYQHKEEVQKAVEMYKKYGN